MMMVVVLMMMMMMMMMMNTHVPLSATFSRVFPESLQSLRDTV